MLSARPRTVSNAVARALLGAANEMSVSPDALLKLAGLTRADVLAPGGRIPGPKHQVLMQLAAHAPFDPRLFDGGLQFLFVDFRNLAAVCGNAPTLRQAIDAFVRYRGVIGELDTLVCHERDGVLQFDYHPEAPAASGGRSALANFAMLVKLARHYDGAQAARFSCALQGQPIRQQHDAEDFLRCRIGWDQAVNTLQLYSTQLDTPFPQHNALLHEVFSAQLAAEFDTISRPDTFAGQVERLARDALVSGATDGDDSLLAYLCESLHISRWTLRRRLQGDGCSASDIIVRVKADEARRLLRESTTPIAEIGDRLGFANPSSFTRFFREREGVSPAVYRGRPGRVFASGGEH